MLQVCGDTLHIAWVAEIPMQVNGNRVRIDGVIGC